MTHIAPQSFESPSVLNALLYRLRVGALRLLEVRARALDVEFLRSLSDAELANRDLTREDIVNHVARQTYFT